VAQPAQLRSSDQQAGIIAWRPELLVVVAYGLILPAAVLNLPRLGCLNIHASLLPRWRGAAPIQRAILAGDGETGVAIMQLEPSLDTGPVFAERRVPITAGITAGELQQQLAVLGAAALLEVIDGLVRGAARAVAQASVGVTYAARISKHEALIDWSQSAAQISQQVRAFNPWPVAETPLKSERVRIWRAHAVSDGAPGTPGSVLGLRAGALLVACGSGHLAIEALQLPGRRVVTAADFAHTHPLDTLRFGAAP
jgi:methionyl-tRNA formyltransferase